MNEHFEGNVFILDDQPIVNRRQLDRKIEHPLRFHAQQKCGPDFPFFFSSIYPNVIQKSGIRQGSARNPNSVAADAAENRFVKHVRYTPMFWI